MKLSTKDIIYIGLLAAVCAVATTIRIPGPNGAMIHFGSAAAYLIALTFGGYYGALAGAIGSAFFDMFMGLSHYTIFSLIIKGTTGLLLGYMTVGLQPPTVETPNLTFLKILIGTVTASIIAAIGWFFAWWIVIQSATIAYGLIPFTLLTSAVGIICALLAGPKLQKIVRTFFHG